MVSTTPLCVSSVASGQYVVNTVTTTVVRVSFMDARAPAAKKIAKAYFMLGYGYDII
jgi:hypothetical protein